MNTSAAITSPPKLPLETVEREPESPETGQGMVF